MTQPAVLTPDKKEVIALLRKHGEAVADDAPFAFERLGEGRGFCSLLYKVSVGTDKTYAVKITNPSGDVGGVACAAGLHKNLHNRECDVYEWVSSYLAAGGRREDVGRLPKTFGARRCEDKEGVLIMEDLSGRATHDVDFIKGYSVAVVKSIICCIAGYQAAYLSAEKKLTPTDKSPIHESLRSMVVWSTEAYPEKEWLPKNGDRWNALTSFYYTVEKLQDGHPDYASSLPLVLTHCDLWPNNLLFGKTTERPDGQLLAIIDWQTAGVGSALFDVASVIGICMTAEDRRLHEQELLDFYVSEMEKRKDRFTQKAEFPRETVLHHYRESLKWAALQLLSTAAGDPASDKAEQGQADGPMSRRLKAILEDIM